jgi:hypothetical protein
MSHAKLRRLRDVSELHPTKIRNILLVRDLTVLNFALLIKLDEGELALQLADLIGGFSIFSRGDRTAPTHISCGRQTYSISTGGPAL